MRGGRRVMAVLLGVATLAVACVSNTEHPVPGGPSFEDEEVRFVAPTGWEVQRTTSVSYGPSQIRLYLANQPLHQDCPTTGSIIECESPLDNGLVPGGMFVVWTTDRCVATQCELPATTLTSIGNRQGVRVPMTRLCEGTGFTERTAYYVTVTPQRVDVLFTCARDPSEATRSAFLGFLDAIRWRIP